jgi:acyl carrier protein
MDPSAFRQQVRLIVAREAGVGDEADLADNRDLWAAGMDSLGSVNLLVHLEQAFDVQFPDELLARDVFTSIDSIAAALGPLLDAAAR